MRWIILGLFVLLAPAMATPPAQGASITLASTCLRASGARFWHGSGVPTSPSEDFGAGRRLYIEDPILASRIAAAPMRGPTPTA